MYWHGECYQNGQSHSHDQAGLNEYICTTLRTVQPHMRIYLSTTILSVSIYVRVCSVCTCASMWCVCVCASVWCVCACASICLYKKTQHFKSRDKLVYGTSNIYCRDDSEMSGFKLFLQSCPVADIHELVYLRPDILIVHTHHLTLIVHLLTTSPTKTVVKY